MQFEIFQQSINSPTPPEGSSVYLLAMWYDGGGNWSEAHKLVDNLDDELACWVHAYLHRKEGDQQNAAYWYRRAGKSVPSITLQQEWEMIVKVLL